MKKPFITLATLLYGMAALVAGAYSQEPRCTEQGSIRSVTKAASGSVETVTFELNSKTLPAVEITNEKPPIQNYSGANLHMRGPLFKGVHIHMVAWNCRIREDLGSKTRTITGVKQTEQFEGYVSYAIGYTSKKKYVGVTKITGPKVSKVIVKFRR